MVSIVYLYAPMCVARQTTGTGSIPIPYPPSASPEKGSKSSSPSDLLTGVLYATWAAWRVSCPHGSNNSLLVHLVSLDPSEFGTWTLAGEHHESEKKTGLRWP